MLYKSISKKAFSLWSLVVGLEGLLAAYFIVREPSEAESAFAFGFSAQRLLIFVGVASLALFFVSVAVAHFYQCMSWNQALNKRPRLFRSILIGSAILEIAILHLLFLLPEYLFPALSGYLFRLKPALIWLALIFVQTFFFLAFFGGVSLADLKEWRINKPFIIFLSMIVALWGLFAITGIGITPDEFYWNMAGVPLLAWQIWVAAGVTLTGWFLCSRFVRQKGLSRLLVFIAFFGIWLVSAIVWIRTPLTPTFNAPGPYLPTKGFYPFVDAALFDLGAQSANYGRGIFFGKFFDRGLLMGFLALIHKIFGQNYLKVVSVQSAVFAIYPALLYILGEKLHSKSAGMLVAVLAVFKVVNAIIGGKLLSTSHPKLMLTEFPTGIVLILFTLFLVLWLRKELLKTHYLVGAGAAIGIGILLRTHVFFMVPVLIIFGFLIWKQNWKHAFRDALLIIIVFFITISPWMWRNYQVAGEPMFFMRRFNSVIDERYQPQGSVDSNRTSLHPSPRALQINDLTPRSEKNGIFEQYQFIPNHFVHNIITSVLILPPSPVLGDLRHVVDNYPYWGRMPNMGPGQISIPMGIFLTLNLMILSLGFGAAWKRVRWAAFVPLAVFLFYNLANAFARTSGGRYIVPVDWVIYFYYAIGLVEIIQFFISLFGFNPGDFFTMSRNRTQHETNEKFNWGKAGLTILPFFLIVASLPVIELASPGAPPPETKASLLQKLDEAAFFETSGFSRSEVDEFLSDPDARLISGRGLYPRYYTYDQGEPILPGRLTVYTARDYPRLVFTLLLPDTDRPVLLPIDQPRLYFPDAAKVIVGGCQVDQGTVWTSYLNYIDAAFVVILDETGVVYTRVPDAPLECPLHEPVCDNNHNCH